MERILKGPIVAYFRLISWQMYGRTEEYHKGTHSGQVMFRPRFEPDTSLVQVQIVTVKPTCSVSPHQFHAFQTCLTKKINSFICNVCAFIVVLQLSLSMVTQRFRMYNKVVTTKAIKAQRGNIYIQLGARWECVVNSIPRPIYLRARTPVPIEQEARLVPEPVWTALQSVLDINLYFWMQNSALPFKLFVMLADPP